MKQDLILLPLIAMVILTFIVGMVMLKLRFKAVKEDGLNPGYFLLNRGAKLPDNLAKVTNHYANLFEMPLLFYIFCLAIYAGQRTDFTYITIAWLFAVVRYFHAYIHTTYNDLKHRRFSFLIGSVLLASMWIRLGIQIVS